MTMNLFAALIAASLVATPVAASAAGTGASQQTTAAAQAAKNTASTEEKKICRQLPSSTSRLPERACLTAKQWKELDQDSQ